MRAKRSIVAVLGVIILSAGYVFGQAKALQTVEPKPLVKAVSPVLKPVQGGPLGIPLITWGGDVKTIHADMAGIFAGEQLQVKLHVENDFAKQVQACLDGKTPFVRGTMGMINLAGETFKAAGTELVPLDQLSWSNGGDCAVVRPSVTKPEDLKGKTIALQLYGPHMDYVANILASAGLKPSDVKFRWFRELSLPKEATNQVIDPVTAFLTDPTIDAVMCISPDAATLTSGGKVGTGAEGSVKGAKILLSTKTGSRIIADVYAVRADWFAAHRDEVQRFAHALLRAEESLRDLVAAKAQKGTEYKQLLAKAGDLLLGSDQATADVEGMLADCEFVGHPGNVAFFTGQGTTRTLKILTDEIQTAFIDMGFLSGKTELKGANWDYAALAAGLKYAQPIATLPKFDTAKVTARIESKINAETEKWEDEGTLFQVEINFDPNQAAFSADRYADAFRKALSISQTYSGAVVVIEGHSDPLGIIKAREKGGEGSVLLIAQMEQSAKNLSLTRANAVRTSYLEFVFGGLNFGAFTPTPTATN